MHTLSLSLSLSLSSLTSLQTLLFCLINFLLSGIHVLFSTEGDFYLTNMIGSCINILSYLFSFRESVQDYKIHMDMEIVKFA
jgi:hypothetical protein